MAQLAHISAFRQLVLAALCQAQQLIATREASIDTNFHIASPEGAFRISMGLSSEINERARQMALISRFLAWKLSPGFIMTGELREPSVVFAAGISQKECGAAFAIIQRKPLYFSPPQWLSDKDADGEMKQLLIGIGPELSGDMIEELKDWFGPGGRFPAVRMG